MNLSRICCVVCRILFSIGCYVDCGIFRRISCTICCIIRFDRLVCSYLSFTFLYSVITYCNIHLLSPIDCLIMTITDDRLHLSPNNSLPLLLLPPIHITTSTLLLLLSQQHREEFRIVRINCIEIVIISFDGVASDTLHMVILTSYVVSSAADHNY